VYKKVNVIFYEIVSILSCFVIFPGSTEIRVWDLLSGGRLLSKISQHHKTITALKFASQGKRLLSASLDRHVKVYDMSTYEVIRSFDYSSPILSLGISPGDQTLIVGMSDGIIAIARKEEEIVQDEEENAIKIIQEKRKKSKTYSSFIETEFGIKEDLIQSKL
jgi:U3 small nucleolar RNA-associated protein 15